MKQTMVVVRERQTVDLRRMAEAAIEVERGRKLLALADKWDEEARQLEETLDGPES